MAQGRISIAPVRHRLTDLGSMVSRRPSGWWAPRARASAFAQLSSPVRASPARAYAAGADGVTEIPFIEAGDLIDPAGTNRCAWHRRVRASGLKATPARHHMTAGHGYEVDVVYDWHGQEYVAVVTRNLPSYVWARAVTYAEAVSLGIA